jgi:hypothetical protein
VPALAAVVAPADEAVGGVVAVGEDQAGGQGHRLDRAVGLVGERGGLAADGLGQEAVAQVVGVGGGEAIGGGRTDNAVGAVVGVAGDVAQGVGAGEDVAARVVGVAGDGAVGLGGGGYQLLGVVGPLPELGLVGRRVGDRRVRTLPRAS